MLLLKGNMNKEKEKEFKEKLESEKEKLTKDLKFFAKKDPKVKRNWITRFPFFGSNRTHSDEIAEEIEEYENLLPVEYSLETRLKDTEEALDKIKKGKYGKCENCKKDIEIKRLEAAPEAKTCLVCSKKNRP
ncbi:MAG: TraR/DksA C4-type zinc finger protein [Candidatus Portnoybacteria bacterium]